MRRLVERPTALIASARGRAPHLRAETAELPFLTPPEEGEFSVVGNRRLSTRVDGSATFYALSLGGGDPPFAAAEGQPTEQTRAS
ncbi:hypothetical protein NOCA2290023 [metagenome]|uniref:Uncharacterized protein n=1 Tax=metagenome TaxID=256318 RepID=A0A2P2C0X0_9ZZZZ